MFKLPIKIQGLKFFFVCMMFLLNRTGITQKDFKSHGKMCFSNEAFYNVGPDKVEEKDTFSLTDNIYVKIDLEEPIGKIDNTRGFYYRCLTNTPISYETELSIKIGEKSYSTIISWDRKKWKSLQSINFCLYGDASETQFVTNIPESNEQILRLFQLALFDYPIIEKNFEVNVELKMIDYNDYDFSENEIQLLAESKFVVEATRLEEYRKSFSLSMYSFVLDELRLQNTDSLRVMYEQKFEVDTVFKSSFVFDYWTTIVQTTDNGYEFWESEYSVERTPYLDYKACTYIVKNPNAVCYLHKMYYYRYFQGAGYSENYIGEQVFGIENIKPTIIIPCGAIESIGLGQND